MEIYEAIILDHSDFGKIRYREMFKTERHAKDCGEHRLANLQEHDPEYANSYDLKIYRHVVR